VWTRNRYREKNPAPHAGFNERDLSATEVVGFAYLSKEMGLFEADRVENIFWRTAYAFDVSALRYRIPLAATLRAEARGVSELGVGGAPCITDVGTGTGPWWQEKPKWLEGQFNQVTVPNQSGVNFAVDVMSIVAPWLRGEPNYGFVLKNRDENIDAFANKSCTAYLSNPVLEISYY